LSGALTAAAIRYGNTTKYYYRALTNSPVQASHMLTLAWAVCPPNDDNKNI
jgi:hypothetical protein|tara:strand:+ start:45 stop:197 length:153 start_codon:yes stop_codon:yes gene_type:complete